MDFYAVSRQEENEQLHNSLSSILTIHSSVGESCYHVSKFTLKLVLRLSQ